MQDFCIAKVSVCALQGSKGSHQPPQIFLAANSSLGVAPQSCANSLTTLFEVYDTSLDAEARVEHEGALSPDLAQHLGRFCISDPAQAPSLSSAVAGKPSVVLPGSTHGMGTFFCSRLQPLY